MSVENIVINGGGTTIFNTYGALKQSNAGATNIFRE